LHTIVLDPVNKQRMYVAISAGGVYRTDDGGATWTAQNQGIRTTFMPDKYPEFGQCVHKIVLHPDRPERLFLQNHWGLYRSDNCGEKWTDIANGVPSDFGFAVLMHPRNPDCVYVIPVESDEFRCACDGRLRVYRTRNGGASWEPLARGLPQKGAYEAGSSLAHAMKDERGTRSSKDCPRCCACETQLWRTVLADYGSHRRRLHHHQHAQRNRSPKAKRGRGDCNASHFSHSGGIARIHCRTRQSRDRRLTHNLG
jgi:hypothetical protein